MKDSLESAILDSANYCAIGGSLYTLVGVSILTLVGAWDIVTLAVATPLIFGLYIHASKLARGSQHIVNRWVAYERSIGPGPNGELHPVERDRSGQDTIGLHCTSTGVVPDVRFRR